MPPIRMTGFGDEDAPKPKEDLLASFQKEQAARKTQAIRDTATKSWRSMRTLGRAGLMNSQSGPWYCHMRDQPSGRALLDEYLQHRDGPTADRAVTPYHRYSAEGGLAGSKTPTDRTGEIRRMVTERASRASRDSRASG